ncbi:MAG: multidrug effflux MFS transporter, partial [Rhodospirillaceae bacterium]
MVAIGPVSTDLYLPSLPSIGEVFGAPVSQAQLTLSAFIAGFAVTTIIYGPLADRFGRKPPLVAGMALFTVSSFGCLFATSIEALIVWRFFQAVGGCAGPVVARAIVRDLYEREDAARVLSFMAAAMALAPSVAPIVGGWIHIAFGWQGHFLVLGLAGMAMVGLCAFTLDETNDRPDVTATSPGRLAGNIAVLLKHRIFIGYVTTFALSYCCLFSFISGGAFVLIRAMDVAPQNFGYYFFFVAGSFAIGAFMGGRMTRRMGLLRMIAIGVGLGIVGAAAGLALSLAGIAHPLAVVVPIAVMFFGCAFVFPNATA